MGCRNPEFEQQISIARLEIKFKEFRQEILYKTKRGIESIDGIKNIIAVASERWCQSAIHRHSHVIKSLQKLGAKWRILDADIYGPSMPRIGRLRQTGSPDNKSFIPVNANGIGSVFGLHDWRRVSGNLAGARWLPLMQMVKKLVGGYWLFGWLIYHRNRRY